MLIEHIWPLANKLKKHDTFAVELSQVVMAKILQYHDIT